MALPAKAAVTLLALAATCVAEPRVTTLATGLAPPLSLCVRQLPETGAASAVIVEGGSGRILAADAARPSVAGLISELQEPDTAAGVAAALFGNGALLVCQTRQSGAARYEVHRLATQSGELTATVTQRVATGSAADSAAHLIADGQFVYQPATQTGRVKIRRSRHAGGMIATPATLPQADNAALVGSVTGIANRGDAELVLAVEAEGRSRLVFGVVGRLGLTSVVSLNLPLTGIRALAFESKATAVDRRLYAVAADGLYRLDADINASGRPAIAARRLVAITNPLALAAAPGGGLLVVAGEGEASLLRIDL